jgi:hypothetical protein
VASLFVQVTFHFPVSELFVDENEDVKSVIKMMLKINLIDFIVDKIIQLKKSLSKSTVSFALPPTFEACRRAGIVAVSARQLKPIEKLKLKLTTKSQIEFGQARY